MQSASNSASEETGSNPADSPGTAEDDTEQQSSRLRALDLLADSKPEPFHARVQALALRAGGTPGNDHKHTEHHGVCEIDSALTVWRLQPSDCECYLVSSLWLARLPPDDPNTLPVVTHFQCRPILLGYGIEDPPAALRVADVLPEPA